MIVIGTLLQALAQILHMVINIYIWVIIIAALISWVRPDPYNPIVQTLYRLTEPVYAWIRRYIPTIIGGIDLAPLIVIIALQFIDLFFVRLLMQISVRLGA
ncbi:MULTISPECIES: YggT family protein [unclassified Nitratiruptor]|uniref:YggT family protein n=1 Tax=unclassified Nitratiruptor TaxID=2624044 RepID=UPI0019152C59|nr:MULTISPECIES: YggT family protein [unclassified Nitratiruptor]BCD60480.1 YggT family protein [Nitratiruptor sp. YY08-10]BCD64031.1 YggT family protein [Nitratiruptor sp. YY08-14]